MNWKFATFLGLVLFLAADIHRCLGKETNAYRMRRGLPPLPPRFLLLKRAAEGTATTAANAKPSYNPQPKLFDRSHRIQVFAGNGNSIGYVRHSPPINSRISLDTASGQDLRVSVSGKGPFDIVIENPKSHGAPLYLGASKSSNLDLPKMTLSILKKAHRANGIQSTIIWSIDAETRELKARYVDPDGTKSLLNLVFDSHRDEILFMGDLNTHSDHDEPSAIPVRLYLSKD